MPESKKDDEETTSSRWTYDGAEEKDWDAFDRRMMRCCRKHYGIFGEGLWMGTHPDPDVLDGAALTEYTTDTEPIPGNDGEIVRNPHV